MCTPLLATKLRMPRRRPKVVRRHHLIERLNAGQQGRLTLVVAPAGFGKTTLVTEWIGEGGRRAAWLSLDEGDNSCPRFLAYLIAALQTVSPGIGHEASGLLRSPQPAPVESILAALLNEIGTLPDRFVLVLDDYHLVGSEAVDHALGFLLERLPAQMHLVISTREEPHLPVARLRARGELNELRAADLRFSSEESRGFLSEVMGLDLSAEDVAALEARTEGWIAGMQLAALSMRGHTNASDFIKSFTGSHRFVTDYLIENVLEQQAASVQSFLLHTSILNRLCGPLCDALLALPSGTGQGVLDYLEQANLFIVPLDDERRWYRYHPLFTDLLRERLHQLQESATSSELSDVPVLHGRASQWYEDHGLETEALYHAAAAKDIERAQRLVEGKGMPLHFRGAVVPVLNWLASLPKAVLDSRPSLWVTYASAQSMNGPLAEVEPKLQAAEKALRDVVPNEETRNLVGHIASIRAMLAAVQNQVEVVMAQSQRALENLHPGNLAVRASTIWKLGWAHALKEERTAASQAFSEAIVMSQASGNGVVAISSMVGLGNVQEAQNQLVLAAQTFRRVLELASEPPLPAATCEVHLGLARILYQWNDLEAAQRHAEQGLRLAQQLARMDKRVAYEVVLARLQLARGGVSEASAALAQAAQLARQHGLVSQIPEITTAQVVALLRQGNLTAAARLTERNELPMAQARVRLAQNDGRAAMALLEPWRLQADAREWQNERLGVRVLQALALRLQGEREAAVDVLAEALALAEPGGFLRIFIDGGLPLAELLSEAAARRIMPAYVAKLQAALGNEAPNTPHTPNTEAAPPHTQPLVEPLSDRELEVLRLIARGLSNQEIGARLFISLSTVKGHNLRIFGKLQVQRRTEAVARARELRLL